MKKVIVILASFIVVFSMVGCADFEKDIVLDKYDKVINKLGNESLNKDKNLIGDREFGNDSYVGTYSTQYDSFTGNETIFGGTGLERANKEFTLQYKVEVKEGSFKLVLITGADEEVIVEATEEGTYRYDFNQSDLYIKIVGNDFSGDLEIEIKD